MNSECQVFYKKLMQIFFILVMVVAVLPSVALATTTDDYQLSKWTTGVGAGALFLEGDDEFNSSLLLEAKVGYDINERFTVEGSFGYLPYMDAEDHTAYYPETWHLNRTQAFRNGVDLLYHLGDSSSRYSFHPYLAATGGVMYYSNSLKDGHHFDAYTGGGGGLEYHLSRNWSTRGDYRLIVALEDGEINHTAVASVVYRWGSRPDRSATGEGAETMNKDEHDLGLQVIHFDFDKSSLTAEAQSKLDDNAKWLRENSSTRVTLEGYCDERGTDEYNLALGERRARSAKQYLEVLGIDSDRMDTISYGEERPVDPASNEAAWAKNRRVETKAKY